MNPVHFPEANTVYGPPPDLAESQCMRIPAWRGEINSGSVDGSETVVVAWSPTPEEIELIRQGKPIFLSFIGWLPPHFPSMDFHAATHPA